MAKIDLGFSCGERWESMALHPDGRHCGACGEKVVDLSRLTRKEAARLIERPDAPCVSFEVATDGEVVFRPELRRAPGLLAIGAAGLLAACSSEEPAACEIRPDPVEIAAPPDATAAPEGEGSARVASTPQLAPTSLPGAPSPSATGSDSALAGDANDVDGADPAGHHSGSAVPTVHRTHRLAGRRPSISYTRRDRNL